MVRLVPLSVRECKQAAIDRWIREREKQKTEKKEEQ